MTNELSKREEKQVIEALRTAAASLPNGWGLIALKPPFETSLSICPDGDIHVETCTTECRVIEGRKTKSKKPSKKAA